MRSLLIFLVFSGGIPWVAAQVGDRAEIDKSAPPAHWQVPPSTLLTVEASMASFEVAEGFRLELVAAEPLVQDPVAIQFDEQGRLWVVEWPAYNWPLRKVLPGFPIAAPPNARIVLLEDSNRDGRMDRRTVFMDHADWPRGLQVARDGALVLRLPKIVFARDTDANGIVDAEEEVVAGLEVPVNPHGAQSNLMLAMDNWVYGSSFPERLRHRAGGWERAPAVRLRGQWGISQDNYGRLFYASNGDHLRGNLVPAHYYARNPGYLTHAGVDVKYPADQTTWPHAATPGTNRRAHLRETDGTLQVFTSNTAPVVYRGDQFPAEFRGNVFLGEVAGRFIRRSILTEEAGELTARNAYPQREFAFSRDERFRPVYAANGPDGTLYIADMHRGIIEGDIFVTSFLRNQIEERKLQEPFNGLGRIYRVVHHAKVPRLPAAIGRTDSAAWVERLAHPNGFWRDTAQRVLVENGDRTVVPALQKMAAGHRDELARLHAGWTLEGLGGLTAPVVAHALQDTAPKIRVAALRWGEPLLGDAQLSARVIGLLADPDFEVRRQLAFTLGEGRGAPFEDALLALVAKDMDKPGVVEAAVSGLRGREVSLVERVMVHPDWKALRKGGDRFVAALAESVLHGENFADLDALLRRAGDPEMKPVWPRLAILAGLAARPKHLARLPLALAGLEQSTEDPVRSRAAELKKTWATATVSRANRTVSGENLERGKAVYALCAGCHGPEGKGLPGIGPALENSPVVASADDLVKSILLGRNLDRANQAFPDMPSLAGLPDADIAAVASYVRAQWGPPSRAIPLGRVRQLRQEVGAPASPPAPTDTRPATP